jgi:hypothetical protein
MVGGGAQIMNGMLQEKMVEGKMLKGQVLDVTNSLGTNCEGKKWFRGNGGGIKYGKTDDEG